MTEQPTQIAFITDAKALKPTLIALWSALRNASSPVRAILIGIDLSGADWHKVTTVVETFAHAELRPIPFDMALLEGVVDPNAHISRATYARLFLHRFVEGRVLYLDGDILVTGDLTRIQKTELAEQPAAAVSDIVVQKRAVRAQHEKNSTSAATRLAQFSQLTAPFPVWTYVNAGVLWLDTDRIRADRDLAHAIEDVTAASKYKLADQDHLNKVMAGRFVLLGAEWNCSWNRLKRQRHFQTELGAETDEASTAKHSIITHYHGRYKPWHPITLKSLTFASAIFQYRREVARFRRKFPQLI